MKRPASQYYWGDWRRDTALQGCSIAARGLWHEMNCLMHDCEPYGHLCVGSKPMQPAQLARLVGVTPKECQKLLGELEAAGVFSRAQDGAIFSRRMVRDESLRERRASGGQLGAEHGSKGGSQGVKGGRPKSTKGGFETPLTGNIKPPPASASASALVTETEDSERAARAPAPEPDTQGHQPTPQGLICRAMRAQGLQAVNPGDPRLLALIDQGATMAEFEGLAAEAVSKHKGFAWLLATLQARRQDAASIALAKVEPARQPWAGAL